MKTKQEKNAKKNDELLAVKKIRTTIRGGAVAAKIDSGSY